MANRYVAIGLLLLTWLMPLHETAAGTTTSGMQAIQALYDQKEYQKVLDELAKLDSNMVGSPDVRRLKIRTLLR